MGRCRLRILRTVMGMYINRSALYDHLPSLPVWSMVLTDHCTRVSMTCRWCQSCTVAAALWRWGSSLGRRSGRVDWYTLHGPTVYSVLSICGSCLLLLRHGMLKSRLRKGWWLIRLCWRLIGRHSLEHRVISNSRELGCKLLIYSMELGKSLLKLWRKLSLGESTGPVTMPVSRGMYVIMWYSRYWNVTMDSWRLRCIYGLTGLWVLRTSGAVRAAMCNLRWQSRLALARVCCRR